MGIKKAIGSLSITVREHADGVTPALVVATVRCVTPLAEARNANKAEVGKATIQTFFPNTDDPY